MEEQEAVGGLEEETEVLYDGEEEEEVAGKTVEDTAPKDDSERKVFVGGLAWTTLEPGLKAYFENYGEVVHVNIMVNHETKQPRGFGFVTFATVEARNAVLATPTHTIDQKTVEVKPAQARGAGSKNFETNKIFVGGIDHDVTESEFREYFTQFGEVTDCVVRMARGFGFITFKDESAMKAVLSRDVVHSLRDRPFEVKRATPQGQGGGKGYRNGYHQQGYRYNNQGRGGKGGYQHQNTYGYQGGYGPYNDLGMPHGGKGYGPYGGNPYSQQHPPLQHGAPYGKGYGGRGGGGYGGKGAGYGGRGGDYGSRGMPQQQYQGGAYYGAHQMYGGTGPSASAVRSNSQRYNPY